MAGPCVVRLGGLSALFTQSSSRASLRPFLPIEPLCFLFFLCSLGFLDRPGVVYAQAQPKKSNAQNTSGDDAQNIDQMAEHSTTLFSERKFEQAATLLERAFAKDPQPVFLFNIAQAYRLSDKPKKALASYQRFVGFAPQHSLVPEARGYIADMRVILAEQEKAVAVRRLLEVEQTRSKMESELLHFRAEQAEREKKQLTEELRKSRIPLYKRPWFWGVLGGATAVAATVVGLGVYYGTAPQPDGGFVEIHF